MAVIVCFDRMVGEDTKSEAYGPCDLDVAHLKMAALEKLPDCVGIEIIPLQKGQWTVCDLKGVNLSSFCSEQEAIDWIILRHPGATVSTKEKEVHINGNYTYYVV